MNHVAGEPKASRMRRPLRLRQPWTAEEELQLERRWGRFSIESIARVLSRTPSGVRTRALKLRLGGTGRGVKTLCRLERETGYDKSKILSAAKFLGIELARSPSTTAIFRAVRSRSYRIDLPEEEKILAFLRSWPDGRHIVGLRYKTSQESWSARSLAGCLDCQSSEKKHWTRGRCKPCDDKMRKRRAREKQRVQTCS